VIGLRRCQGVALLHVAQRPVKNRRYRLNVMVVDGRGRAISKTYTMTYARCSLGIASRLVRARRTHDRGAHLRRSRRELTLRVALVADEGLAAAAWAMHPQPKADLTLVVRKRSEYERARGTVTRADGKRAQAPEPARTRGTVAAVGERRKRRALRDLAAASALDRSQVDEQQLVAVARTGVGKDEPDREPLRSQPTSSNGIANSV